MKAKPKQRIEINPTPKRLAGLGQALANLNPVASPVAEPNLRNSTEPVWKMGHVLLRRETAHRAGRTVVVVYDFASHLPASVIEKVAKKLRTTCGTGGTVRARTIEIQGDQIAKVREALEAEGFVVGGVKE